MSAIPTMTPITSIGSGAAAEGAAEGAAGSSLLGPLAIGLFLALGGLSAFQQAAANEAIKKAAEENIRRINEQIGDRFKGLFRQETAQSRQGLSTIGRVSAALGRTVAARKSSTEGFEGGGVTTSPSGVSIRALYNQLNRDIAQGAKDIKDAAVNEIETLRQQRQAVKDSAKSSQQAPILAAIGGGARGASLGLQLGGAIDNNRAALASAEQARQLRDARIIENVGRVSAAEQNLGFQQKLLDRSQIEFFQQLDQLSKFGAFR